MYLYVVSAKYFTYNSNDVLQEAVKIGTTKNINQRLASYQTGHANKIDCMILFKLDESNFKLENDLYRLDSIRLPLYLKQYNLEHLNCDLGGGKEWYWLDQKINYEQLLKNFLQQENIIYEKIEHVFIPFERNEFLDFELLKEYLQRKLKIKLHLPQLRLWDHFVNLSKKENVTGILEWMMGVGKTVAALEMLTIARKREGYLRGLIVSHRTDILEQFYQIAKILDIPSFRKYSKYQEQPFGNNYILFISHQTLINYDIPDINFFLYDEVHRISGPELNDKMKNYFNSHNIKYILGLSATPIINIGHKEYIQNIYGNKINILDSCDYSEALSLGIVARLKFHLIYREKGASQKQILKSAREVIEGFLTQNAIITCPTSIEDQDLTREFFENNFPITTYKSKKKFEQDDTSQLKGLFACRKYQEGTNLKNVGLSFIFTGNTIEPYIIYQIAGRVARLDYEGKQAKCVLFWTGKIETIRELVKFLGKNFYKDPREERKLFEDLIGSIKLNSQRVIDGIDFFKELTDPSIKFDRLRNKVISRGITDLGQYKILMKNDYDYVENPETEFVKLWKGEKHFFNLPEETISLDEIIRKCKELSLNSLIEYEKYSEKGILPKRPLLYYPNFVETFYEELM